MKLEALQLENFRGLASIRLDGLPQFTIVTGPPGAGRTVLAVIESLLTSRCSPALEDKFGPEWMPWARAVFALDRGQVRHWGPQSVASILEESQAVHLAGFLRNAGEIYAICETHGSACKVSMGKAGLLAILTGLKWGWSSAKEMADSAGMSKRSVSELFLRSQVAYHSGINFFTLDLGPARNWWPEEAALSAVADLLPWPPGQQVILAADSVEGAEQLPGAEVIRLEEATPISSGVSHSQKGGAVAQNS